MNQDRKTAFKKQPLVSVIMPCYNSEKFISEAIESVLNQRYINKLGRFFCVEDPIIFIFSLLEMGEF
jgi:glycosyltransferase involved in cell wall biosynthesis